MVGLTLEFGTHRKKTRVTGQEALMSIDHAPEWVTEQYTVRHICPFCSLLLVLYRLVQRLFARKAIKGEGLQKGLFRWSYDRKSVRNSDWYV